MPSLLQDAAFWGGIAALVVGLLKFAIDYGHKSKCENFALCWGLVRVRRNIAAEVELGRAELEAGHPENVVDESKPRTT